MFVKSFSKYVPGEHSVKAAFAFFCALSLTWLLTVPFYSDYSEDRGDVTVVIENFENKEGSYMAKSGDHHVFIDSGQLRFQMYRVCLHEFAHYRMSGKNLTVDEQHNRMHKSLFLSYDPRCNMILTQPPFFLSKIFTYFQQFMC